MLVRPFNVRFYTFARVLKTWTWIKYVNKLKTRKNSPRVCHRPRGSYRTTCSTRWLSHEMFSRELLFIRIKHAPLSPTSLQQLPARSVNSAHGNGFIRKSHRFVDLHFISKRNSSRCMTCRSPRGCGTTICLRLRASSRHTLCAKRSTRINLASC